jgi:hypothetical protein
VLAGEAAADVVVGGDEADVVVSLEPRVEDDDRDAPLHGAADRSDERRVVQRREGDAGDAAGDGVLDFRDLRVAVVFAERAAPGDGHAELLRRFLGAGVDALPEHVGGALRDHGDGHAAGFFARRAGAGRRPERQRGDECSSGSHRF